MVTRSVRNVNSNGVIAGRVRRESVVGAVPALISSVHRPLIGQTVALRIGGIGVQPDGVARADRGRTRRDRACIQAMRRYYNRLGRLWRSRPLTNVAEVHSETTGQLHAEIPEPARYGGGAIKIGRANV